MAKFSAIIILKRIFFQRDLGLILSFISIFAGIVLGVTVYFFADSSFENELINLFAGYNASFLNKEIYEIIYGIVISSAIYFTAMFILGGSLFGRIFCLPLTAYKSLGLSALLSQIYIKYGLKGFEYALLIFFPGKIILIFAMLLYTKTCYDMSVQINNSQINASQNLSYVAKNYYIKSALIFLIFAFSWLIDLLCIFIFGKLFDFT